MNILGLNHGEYNSSAALVIDGKLVAAAPEERFSRKKKTKEFPLESIRFCLESQGLQFHDVDCIAQAWNPTANWCKFNPLISGTRIRREDYFYSLGDNLYRLSDRTPGDWVSMNFDQETGLPTIYYVQHHRTHSALAFFQSPFDEAAILTCDWRGELESTTLGVGRGCELETLQSQWMPHSMGMFYAAYTELLGYRPHNDEWKVMAISAYDVDCSEMLSKIRQTYRLVDDGNVELDSTYYKGAILDQPGIYTEKLRDLLGGRSGVAGDEPDEWSMKIARAMQTASEEIAAHFLTHLHAKTGLDQVVLGGGFFMNCVINGKVTQMSPFKDVYVSFAPDDLGNSIGAALYVAHCLKNEPRVKEPVSSYLGPMFSDEEISSSLKRRGIKARKMDQPEQEVARILASGEIVAMFQGRMEFGERALGHRSILADPRVEDMKHRINAMIKYREAYRPFAPAILASKVSDYFEVSEEFSSDFMEKVVLVREQHRSSLPAITHVDGSARVQTVRQEHSPDFYRLIEAFEKETNLPILLNTSFNLNGEPIVLSPDDALNSFFNSGLTHLALGSYLIQK